MISKVSYITAFFALALLKSAIAQTPVPADAESYMSTIKAKQVSEQILQAPFSKDCAKQAKVADTKEGLEFETDAKKKEYEACITNHIDKISNEDIGKISKNMRLESYDKNAAKSTTSIKEYLQKRLHTAIYGVNPDDKEKQLQDFKDKKIVDHNIFYQLYSEQIGKNSILQISQYCLEHFGGENAEDFYIPGNTANFVNNLILPAKTPNANRVKFDDLEPNMSKIKTVVSSYQDADLVSPIWKQHTKIKEYQVCTLPTHAECKDKYGEGLYRHVKQIEALKKVEFATADGVEPKIIQARYMFCAGTVIKNMCNVYKCKNVYDKNSEQDIIDKCSNSFGININLKDYTNNITNIAGQAGKDSNLKGSVSTNTDNTGYIACNVQNRLRENKQILGQIKALQDSLKRGTAKQTDIDSLQNKLQVSGRLDIGAVTTVASKDMAEGVSEFINGDTNSEQLKNDCMDEQPDGKYELKPDAKDNKKCAVIIAKLDKNKYQNIELAEQAQSAIKLKEIDNITDQKELEDFLNRNNMSEYITGDKKLSTADLDELKLKVAQEYKAKKLALISSLQSRFTQEMKLDKAATDQSKVDEALELENEIAIQSIADVKEHKNRVETLLQYSNVVSSYLVAVDQNSGKKSLNEVGLNAETDNARDDNDYIKYFNSSGASSSQNATTDYVQLINEVISDKKSTEE